jgi:hypothetical protein
MDTRPIKVLVIDSDAPASSELCGKLADAKNVSFGVEVARTISEGFELLGAARFDAAWRVSSNCKCGAPRRRSW